MKAGWTIVEGWAESGWGMGEGRVQHLDRLDEEGMEDVFMRLDRLGAGWVEGEGKDVLKTPGQVGWRMGRGWVDV